MIELDLMHKKLQQTLIEDVPQDTL